MIDENTDYISQIKWIINNNIKLIKIKLSLKYRDRDRNFNRSELFLQFISLISQTIISLEYNNPPYDLMLEKFKNLEEIRFVNNSSNTLIDHLMNNCCPKLKILKFNNEYPGRSNLSSKNYIEIKSLNIFFEKLKNLQVLDVNFKQTNIELSYNIQWFSHLKELTFPDNDLSYTGVLNISEMCPHLTKLIIPSRFTFDSMNENNK